MDQAQGNLMTTDRGMTKEESYVERRQLFKNIWETAMHIDEKDEIMNKPKVIKTLRLDEVDKYPIGKTKKQRIKNLRHVCNKILDFCDKQDAEDRFYQQVASGAQPDLQLKNELQPKKLKTHRTRGRKKIKHTKSLFVSHNITVSRVTTSVKDEKDFKNASKPLTPIPIKDIKRTTLRPKPKTVRRGKSVRLKQNPDRMEMLNIVSPQTPGEPTVSRRKIVKKKRSKRKKRTDTEDTTEGF